jgi:hypothetical protein
VKIEDFGIDRIIKEDEYEESVGDRLKIKWKDKEDEK